MILVTEQVRAEAQKMRIDNSYLSSLGAGEIRHHVEASETGQKGANRADKLPPPPLHVPSPELAHLRQLVQISPEVRPDVIWRVSQSLESGYYTSQEAAERTADSMIQAIE